MYRYFVLIWDARDPQAGRASDLLCERLTQAPSGWSTAFKAPGTIAFHAGLGEGASQTCLLQHGAGAVFGRVFARDTDSPHVEFDREETARVLQTRGLRLIRSYWGRYVALLRDGASHETWILRDPSGCMPCLMANHQGVNLVFSDVIDAQQLGLLRFTINWHCIRGWVGNPGLQIRQTGLEEVSEVQLGELVRFSEGATRRSLEWNPFTIAQTDPIQDPATAVSLLRDTVLACVHTWAACHTAVVHNLSGGLDSSIVLSCLATAPSKPQVTCLHYFGTGPDEDERKYARMMAARAGVELIEQQLDASAVRLERMSSVRGSARPWYYMYDLEHGDFEAELARERAASALFSGSGGDGVFFQSQAELAVTDYLFDHGPGPALLRVAADLAGIARKSIWPLLFGALRTRLWRARWNPLEMHAATPRRTLVNPDLLVAVAADESLINPWFAPQLVRGVPPGILWHALSVAVPPQFYNSFEGGPYPERTMPLISQPLVELCLRIPTYVLMRNGTDRATARRAFAPDLPDTIVKRRNKGRVDQHVRNLLDNNLEFVRERLLDGQLVKERMLDRHELERYLDRGHSPADFQYTQILQFYLCGEMWLQRWSQAAAAARD